jgi:hypothetical protein
VGGEHALLPTHGVPVVASAPAPELDPEASLAPPPDDVAPEEAAPLDVVPPAASAPPDDAPELMPEEPPEAPELVPVGETPVVLLAPLQPTAIATASEKPRPALLLFKMHPPDERCEGPAARQDVALSTEIEWDACDGRLRAERRLVGWCRLEDHRCSLRPCHSEAKKARNLGRSEGY